MLVLVEPGLSRRMLLDAVHATGKTKPKRRRLAEALVLDATVLTSGDATGPLVVNQLIDELQARGATNVRRPRCAQCGNVKPVPYKADGQYVCRNCAAKQRCANCGRISHAWYRDRNGQPRCRACRPDPGTADPVADICTIVTRVDPDLEPHLVRQVLALSLDQPLFEVYTELRKFAAHNQAFETAARAKRGISDTSSPGCHLKDKVYFEGIQAVSKHLTVRPEDLSTLYAGKISLGMLPAVATAIASGLLTAPKIQR